MSRDIDDLRHPEWSVSGSEGKSDYMWGYDEGIGNEVCFTLLRKIPDGVRVEVNVYGDTARYLGEVFTERAKHAALVEAAKAVDDYVSGHFSRDKVQYIDCPPCREKLLALRAVLADLEASDD